MEAVVNTGSFCRDALCPNPSIPSDPDCTVAWKSRNTPASYDGNHSLRRELYAWLQWPRLSPYHSAPNLGLSEDSNPVPVVRRRNESSATDWMPRTGSASRPERPINYDFSSPPQPRRPLLASDSPPFLEEWKIVACPVRSNATRILRYATVHA